VSTLQRLTFLLHSVEICSLVFMDQGTKLPKAVEFNLLIRSKNEKNKSYADFIYKKLVLCKYEYDSMEML